MKVEQERFAFGENWNAFVELVDADRIGEAARSLREMLGVDSLAGMSFLDIGCGSGLFSLAAHRLGASLVSIDYDSGCVRCTEQVRRRFADSDDRWSILRGSVLDESWLESLGQFDIVYSWGVLHHTGDLWRAIEVASRRVSSGGRFYFSVYNDQGRASRRWLRIKRAYHHLPRWLRPVWVVSIAGGYELKFAASRLSRGKNPLPFEDWRAKKKDRGMSAWHDWVDWVGGLPFEVATPQAIEQRLADLGFEAERVITVGKGWGCNEFLFRRLPVGAG